MSEKLTLDVGIREIVVNNKEFEDFFDSILEQNALSPEQQTALGNSIKTSVEKRDNMGAFLARLEGEAEMLRKEEKRLADRRRKFERIGEILTEGMHQQMLDWGVRKVEGQRFSFTVKKCPPKVNITDESKIPAAFVSYVPQISKSAIGDALKEGKEVEGAELIQGTRLEIR